MLIIKCIQRYTKMKFLLVCSRDSEAGGEQKEEMLLWYCADSPQAQTGRMCVCARWGEYDVFCLLCNTMQKF